MIYSNNQNVNKFMQTAVAICGSFATIKKESLPEHMHRDGEELAPIAIMQLAGNLIYGYTFGAGDLVVMEQFTTRDTFTQVLALTSHKGFYNAEDRSIRSSVLRLLIQFANFDLHEFYMRINMRLSEIDYGNDGEICSRDDYELITRAIQKCGRLT